MLKGLRTILVAAALLTGWGCHTVKEKTNVSTVENDIRTHLSVGSSRAEVLAYLDQRQIPHEYVRNVEVLPGDKIVLHDSHTEGALIRDVREDGFIFKILVSIRIDFKFDDTDSNLVSFSVREVYKGP
jgi:hypothetical protein